MKKLFFKRHCLFFVTLVIFIISQVWVLKLCLDLYGKKIDQKERIAALIKTLNIKRQHLPENHMEAERQMSSDIGKYKTFAKTTWPNMSKLATNDQSSIPANHIAMFFGISEYTTWAKESCDALGIDFEPTCSFGFSNSFEKNEQPLSSEIYNINQQKEQLKLLLSHLFESRSSYLKIISVERGDTSRSTYFRNEDVFNPTVKQINDGKSYVYKIKFSAFTNTFRNFLKSLHRSEVPVVFRQISVTPTYTFKLTRSNPDQILECLASTFELTVEFIDIPQNFFRHGKKNAAILRKISYQTF
jgi:hypothetical protein